MNWNELWDFVAKLASGPAVPKIGREVFDNVSALGQRAWPGGVPQGIDVPYDWRNHVNADHTLARTMPRVWRRAVANSDLLVFHQTGCEYGIEQWRYKGWLKHVEALLAEGREAELIPLAYDTEWTGGEGAPKERLAERLTFAARFWAIEYHYVITRDGLTLRNAPLDVCTAHGSKGNTQGFGISFEGKWPGFIEGGSEAHAPSLRAQLHLVLDDLQAWMASQGVTDHRFCASAHRCFEVPAERAGDPGVWLWREVIRPVVEEREDLFINPARRHAIGRPLPQSWEPTSPFNDDGALPPLTATAALSRVGDGLRVDLSFSQPLSEDLVPTLKAIKVKVKGKTHKTAPTDWTLSADHQVLSLTIPAPVPPGQWTVTVAQGLKSAPLVFGDAVTKDVYKLGEALIFTWDPDA